MAATTPAANAVRPPIWAANRTDLCETSPVFRNMNGGLHPDNRMYQGILLDNFGSRAEHFVADGSVIVTRLFTMSAGLTARTITNRIALATRTLDANPPHPVAIVFGSRYSALQVALQQDVRYAPGAFYYLTSVFRLVNNTTRNRGAALNIDVMARLECAEPITHRWYANQAYVGPGGNALQTQAQQQTCQTCQKSSDVILNEGWTCLSPDCDRAGRMPDGTPFPTVTYLPTFLQGVLPAGFAATNLPSVRPTMPSAQVPVNQDGLAVWLRSLWRGYICGQCGRMNARRNRNFWSCESCSDRVDSIAVIPAFALVKHEGLMNFGSERELAAIRFRELKYFRNPDVVLEREEYTNDYILYQFLLGPESRVLVRWWKEHALTRRGGADDTVNEILNLFYSGGIPMGRRAFGHTRGTLNRNFLSPSYGSEYKYKVPLGHTAVMPPVVQRLLTETENSTAQLLGGQPNFNQIQLTEYLSGQGMGKHTDGERGVGPCIGSISYGDPCIMRFGPRAHIQAGKDRRGTALIEDSAPPGCAQRAAREALRQQYLPQLANTSKPENERQALRQRWQQELSEIVENVSVKGTRAATCTLDVPLSHGSEVIMFGNKFQTEYEHSITFSYTWRLNVTTRIITDVDATLVGDDDDDHDDEDGANDDNDGDDDDDDNAGGGDDGAGEAPPKGTKSVVTKKRRRRGGADDDDDAPPGPSKRRDPGDDDGNDPGTGGGGPSTTASKRTAKGSSITKAGPTRKRQTARRASKSQGRSRGGSRAASSGVTTQRNVTTRSMAR